MDGSISTLHEGKKFWEIAADAKSQGRITTLYKDANYAKEWTM